MEINRKCWNPLGELSIILNQEDKVFLRRCCYLEPFSILSIEDFLKINNIIEYAYQYCNVPPVFNDEHKDSCLVCHFPKKIEKVTVGLSKACNLRCYHCFWDGMHKDSPETKQLYFKTLENIKRNCLTEIRLNDRGEPFFYYNQTLNYLKSLNPDKDTKQVSFVSSLSTLNETRIKELKQVSDNTGIPYKNITVSIDGITKETFEATRIGANFEKVMNNLELMVKEFGSENVCINYVIKKPNFKDKNIKEFFLKNFNIGYTFVTYDCFDEEAKKVFEEM